ncbi:leucine zipper protein 2 [Protopterus annectens]|uniref:leucine zipper protein 2 n=1 Tax=Protopterus annectens TaxID=7888 RepID=UPI001CF9A0A1|nr:leucine zipper protein 2 [Protopterus annectens]
MKATGVCYLLLFFPALSLTTRLGYEDLERKLKEVFIERSNILRQLSKTSKELEGIKVNFKALKTDEMAAKNDVQKLLDLSQKQREEMKSLQETLQKQLNEAAEKEEKQQATINFLKSEMERKTKIIRDLQQENKSLKHKLVSGSKLCGIHTEESKKIQAQLKDLHYGKKDLIFKAQQLTDLEHKLLSAKQDLERAAIDNESQLKALKETVQLCLSSVLHSQYPPMSVIPSKPARQLTSPARNVSTIPFQLVNSKNNSQFTKTSSSNKEVFFNESLKKNKQGIKDCSSQNDSKICSSDKMSSSELTSEDKEQSTNPLIAHPVAKNETEENIPAEQIVENSKNSKGEEKML